MNKKAKELKKALDNIDGDVECLEVLMRWSDRCGFEVAMQDFRIEVRKKQEATQPDLFSGPMFEKPIEIPKPEVVKDKPLKAEAIKRDTCFNCGLKLNSFIDYIDSEGEIYCADCMKGAGSGKDD